MCSLRNVKSNRNFWTGYSYPTLPQDELQQNESSSFEIISDYSG